MNDEILFLRTLDDIYKSIYSNDEYEILKASGLIRQLFLDGNNSIFDRVNRIHRLKIKFEIAEYDSPLELVEGHNFTASFMELNPEEAPTHWIRKKLKRDDFFAYIVATLEEHNYSIREIIKFVANIMGGIHLGVSVDDKEIKLERLKTFYVFSNVNTALLFIKAIGRSILQALSPLRNKILDIEKFNNSKGFSIFFAMVLLPLINKENFIFDVGVEETNNRLSIFLNLNGELCLRFINNVGKQYLLNAGCSGYSYFYGQRTFLSFQVSFNETELYLCIDDGRWKNIQILPIDFIDFSQKVFDEFNFVVGSNILGKAETHMELIKFVFYDRVLTLDEQIQNKKELTKDSYKEELTVLSFDGLQFYHKDTHPNFITKND